MRLQGGRGCRVIQAALGIGIRITKDQPQGGGWGGALPATHTAWAQSHPHLVGRMFGVPFGRAVWGVCCPKLGETTLIRSAAGSVSEGSSSDERDDCGVYATACWQPRSAA